jgi:hypothetical protein
MWHVYVYVPAAVNFRPTDTFALSPGMSAGAPFAASKNTLCTTEPKSNVTVLPALTVTVSGVNASDGVAITVAPLEDGVDGGIPEGGGMGSMGEFDDPDPHAYNPAASATAAVAMASLVMMLRSVVR